MTGYGTREVIEPLAAQAHQQKGRAPQEEVELNYRFSA
jgi:hypothetical protein